MKNKLKVNLTNAVLAQCSAHLKGAEGPLGLVIPPFADMRYRIVDEIGILGIFL